MTDQEEPKRKVMDVGDIIAEYLKAKAAGKEYRFSKERLNQAIYLALQKEPYP